MSNLYVYLIRSRDKDNKGISDFKDRYKTILEYYYHRYREDEENCYDVVDE